LNEFPRFSRLRLRDGHKKASKQNSIRTDSNRLPRFCDRSLAGIRPRGVN
jgi:hypothetical protein